MVGSRYLDRDLIAFDVGHFAAQYYGSPTFIFADMIVLPAALKQRLGMKAIRLSGRTICAATFRRWRLTAINWQA